MPNGKPGDHPLTDIHIHGLPIFSVAVDTLIEEIHALGGRFPDELAYRLLLNDGRHGGGSDPELVGELQELRDQLERAARANGWEYESRIATIREEVASRWE